VNPAKYPNDCACLPSETSKLWRLLSHAILQSPDFLTRHMRALALVFAFVLCSFIPLPLRAQNITVAPSITTIAGTGTSAYNGDNIVAADAEVDGPYSVAVHGAVLVQREFGLSHKNLPFLEILGN
jgi:hypothetical protein